MLASRNKGRSSKLQALSRRELLARLHEAKENLDAIRSGEVDAIIVRGRGGEKVSTLQGADHIYRAFVEKMNEGAAILSSNHTVLHCNRRFARLVGAKVQSVIGCSMHGLVWPADYDRLDALLRRVALRNCRGEIRLQSLKGVPLPVHLSWNPVRLDGTRAICLIATDLSEVKRAEEALRESIQFKAQIVSNAGEGIVVFDRTLRYALWNQFMEEMSGLPADRVLGKTAWEVFPSDWRIAGVQVYLKKALAGETASSPNLPYTFPASGRSGWIDGIFSPQRNARGEIVGVICMLREISDRKRTEEELHAASKQLRNLAGRLLSVREEERTRIARELHDELGQSLTAVKIDLSWLASRLPRRNRQMLERIRSTLQLANSIIQSGRRISTELRPGILDLGLAAAVEWQAQEFQARTGIQCKVRLLTQEVYEPNISTTMFRILQETLTNVARHARATRVEVVKKKHRDGLVLRIRDNGRGFDPSDPSLSKSLGLMGMRERAAMLGGELKISSAPGKGTRVTAWVPLLSPEESSVMP